MVLKKLLLKLLAQDEIERVILILVALGNELSSRKDHNKLLDKISLISARYNELEPRINGDIISREHVLLEKNKIRDSLLKLINDLQYKEIEFILNDPDLLKFLFRSDLSHEALEIIETWIKSHNPAKLSAFCDVKKRWLKQGYPSYPELEMIVIKVSKKTKDLMASGEGHQQASVGIFHKLGIAGIIAIVILFAFIYSEKKLVKKPAQFEIAISTASDKSNHSSRTIESAPNKISSTSMKNLKTSSHPKIPNNVKEILDKPLLEKSLPISSSGVNEEVIKDQTVVSGSLKDARGQPVSDARIIIKGIPSNSTLSDSLGLFHLSFPRELARKLKYSSTLIIKAKGYSDYPEHINFYQDKDLSITLTKKK